MTTGPNRKRHAIKAARERWLLLGELLQARRQELGYKFRPGFARDRLPLTDDGNPNVRLVTDAEMAYRDTFPPGTLREIARAYAVTYDSVTAVLAGTADALIPATAAAPAATVTQLPPMTDGARAAAVRPYTKPINQRLRDLAAQGVTNPSGVQVFLRTPDDPPGWRGIGSLDDAKLWDGIGARLDIDDRVWFIADLQRRADGRAGSGSGSGEPDITPR